MFELRRWLGSWRRCRSRGWFIATAVALHETDAVALVLEGARRVETLPAVILTLLRVSGWTNYGCRRRSWSRGDSRRWRRNWRWCWSWRRRYHWRRCRSRGAQWRRRDYRRRCHDWCRCWSASRCAWQPPASLLGSNRDDRYKHEYHRDRNKASYPGNFNAHSKSLPAGCIVSLGCDENF